MNYGYIRVSTLTQKIDRQLEEMLNEGLQKSKIFIDRQSGKDFNRENYIKLRKKLKKNDLLIIKSIDRLGRNYHMIIEEWQYITKVKKAYIKVIDMPLLNTKNSPNNLMQNFISDIVLQILSFVAENERSMIKQRQAEGIKIAIKNGVKFGRPKYQLPDNCEIIFNKYKNKQLTYKDCCKHLNMKTSTFFKYYNKYSTTGLSASAQSN